MTVSARAGGHGGTLFRDRLRRLGDVRGEDLLRGQPGEGRTSGQQLIAHHPERVDVGPVIDVRIGGGLFRSHVGRCSERDPDGGEILPPGRLAHRLGHAEIHHQRMAAREHDVVGLDIAVHHPAAMSI